MPETPAAQAQAKTISQLNPDSSLRSTLRNAPVPPADKVRAIAALTGFKNQRGLMEPLGLKNEVSLSRAINSTSNLGKSIRERIAGLAGLKTSDIWPEADAA